MPRPAFKIEAAILGSIDHLIFAPIVAPLDAAENPKRVAGANFPHLLPREPERYEKVAYVHLVGIINITYLAFLCY